MAQRRDFRRIGLLVPSSSSVQEQDFRRVLPEDVTLHVARMRLSNVEADSTLRIVQEIEVESQKLADVDVDVIIFPATAPSSRNGIGYDQELIKRISAASGKPATTASTARTARPRHMLIYSRKTRGFMSGHTMAWHFGCLAIQIRRYGFARRLAVMQMRRNIRSARQLHER
jgi:Arylmalonate decarboxylase